MASRAPGHALLLLELLAGRQPAIKEYGTLILAITSLIYSFEKLRSMVK